VRRLGRAGATAVLVSSLLALCVGCGKIEPAAQGPSSIEEAFEAAHPSGAIPPGLQGVAATREQVAALVGEGVDARVEVVLPTYLPRGFMLAAPYVAVGSGSARPNPETWGDSYRVSYTDGTALVVVTVGAEVVPEGLDWQTSGLSANGRALRTALTASGVVVASVGEPWIVVSGEGVIRSQVVRIARSLSPALPE